MAFSGVRHHPLSLRPVPSCWGPKSFFFSNQVTQSNQNFCLFSWPHITDNNIVPRASCTREGGVIAQSHQGKSGSSAPSPFMVSLPTTCIIGRPQALHCWRSCRPFFRLLEIALRALDPLFFFSTKHY